MSVERIYNELVADYFDCDPFHIYTDSRARALAQIRRFMSDTTRHILDLGQGTGELLLALHEIFPQASLVGMDASQKMIEVAKSKLKGLAPDMLTVVQGDIGHMDRHVDADSVDLVAMHFLMNYIDPQSVFSQVHDILRPGGLFSITTATEESFASLRVMAGQLWSEETIRSETRTVEDAATLATLLTEAGFRIVAQETLSKDISFDDVQSLKEFSFHAGWCASSFLFDLTEEQLKMCEEIARPFLPLEDTVKVAIVLAQKNGPHAS